jgi:hypothetical protein
MPRILALPCQLFLLALAVFAGCRSTPDRIFLGPQDVTLATRRDPSGDVTTWKLETMADTRLRVVREFDRERADVGVQVDELGKEAAERRGVRPYTGMLVTKVAADSPAARAGLLVNDVVQAIDGVEVVYREQFEATIAKVLPGAKLALRVLRGQQPLDVEFAVGRVVARATEERRIDLDIPPTPSRAYAGATLRGRPCWSSTSRSVHRRGSPACAAATSSMPSTASRRPTCGDSRSASSRAARPAGASGGRCAAATVQRTKPTSRCTTTSARVRRASRCCSARRAARSRSRGRSGRSAC